MGLQSLSDVLSDPEVDARESSEALFAAKMDLRRLDPWLMPLTFLGCLAAVAGAWATEDFLLLARPRGRFAPEMLNWQFLPAGFALGTLLFLGSAFWLSPADVLRRSLGFLWSLATISLLFLATIIAAGNILTVDLFEKLLLPISVPMASSVVFFWLLNALLFPLRLFHPGKRNRLSRELMRDPGGHRTWQWIVGGCLLMVLWGAVRWENAAIRPFVLSQVVPGICIGGSLYLILASIAFAANRIIGFGVGLLLLGGSSWLIHNVVNQVSWINGLRDPQIEAWAYTVTGAMIAWLIALIFLAGFQRLPHLSRWKSFEGPLKLPAAVQGQPPNTTRRMNWMWIILTICLFPIGITFPTFSGANPITLAIARRNPPSVPPPSGKIPKVSPPPVAVSTGPQVIVFDEASTAGLEDLESAAGILHVRVTTAAGLSRALDFIANIRYLEVDGRGLSPDDFPTPTVPFVCAGRVTLKNMHVSSRQLACFTAGQVQLINCQLAEDALAKWEPTILELQDCKFDAGFLDRWNRDFSRYFLFVKYSDLENIDLNEEQMRAILKWNRLGLINEAAESQNRIRQWLDQQDYSAEFIKQAKVNLNTDVTTDLALDAGYRKAAVIRPFCYGINLPWPVNAEETQFSTDEEGHLTRLFIDIYNSQIYLDLSNVSFGSLRECTVAAPFQLEDVFKNHSGAIPPLYLRKLQLMLQAYGWERCQLDKTLNRVDLAGLKTLAYPLPIESLAQVQPLPALERLSLPVTTALSPEQRSLVAKYPKLTELRLVYGGNIEFSEQGLEKIRRRFQSTFSQLPPECRLIIVLSEEMHWFEKPIEVWTEGKDYLEVGKRNVEPADRSHTTVDVATENRE